MLVKQKKAVCPHQNSNDKTKTEAFRFIQMMWINDLKKKRIKAELI